MNKNEDQENQVVGLMAIGVGIVVIGIMYIYALLTLVQLSQGS